MDEILQEGHELAEAMAERVLKDIADSEDFAAFLKEFWSETDRGAALVGAAVIDQKLKEILASFFAERRIGAELLDGGNAPLGTLSARIKLALCLGLIDRHKFHECNLIRRIRNEFAHRTHGTTFSDPVIAAHCFKLRPKLPGGTAASRDNPRGVFIAATLLVLIGFTYRSEFVTLQRRTIRTWPHEALGMHKNSVGRFAGPTVA